MRRFGIPLGAFFIAILVGCGPRERSSAGFRLPDGDPVRGKATFDALGCVDCHKISGETAHEASGAALQQIVLGGSVPYAPTDGRLVTAIIHSPRYRREIMKSEGKLPMRDHNDTLTVRQLADIVAFLHTRYHVVSPRPRYYR